MLRIKMKTMLRLLFFFFLLSISFFSVKGIKVLKSDMMLDQDGDPFLTGAKLINDAGKVTVRSFAVCIRFKFKVLGLSNEKAFKDRSTPLDIEKVPKTGRMLKLGVNFPLSSVVIGYPQKEQAWMIKRLKDPLTGKFNLFDTDVWTHMCISYDKPTGYLRIYKDGYPLNLNHPEPLLSQMSLPEDFLDHVYVGRCLSDTPGCSSPEGEYSDLNVWSRSLTEEELSDWTGCRSGLKGDLVDWDRARLELVNMTAEERPSGDVCRLFRPGPVIFPEPHDFYRHVDVCYQMGARPTVVRSSRQQADLSRVASEHGCKFSSWTPSYWAGWWDEPEEGVLSVPVTGELMASTAYAPFKFGSPNGMENSNCIKTNAHRASFTDTSCQEDNCGFCDLEFAPKFILRGLCENSAFDIQYSWGQTLKNGRHYFRGYTTSEIYWQESHSRWVLGLYNHSDVIFATNNDTAYYPFGTHAWRFSGEELCDPPGASASSSASTKLLSFASCTDDDFNCGNGYCVDIGKRCDRRIDCPDKSDEIGCNIFVTDHGYLKDVPPPPPPKVRRGGGHQSSSGKTPVSISVDLLSILEIMEVDGTIAIQLEASLSWRDERLTMYNLKERTDLNTLTTRERNLLWIPEVVFSNTEDKLETMNDNKAYMTISRLGGFRRSRTTELENAYAYRGRDNPLRISRVYSSRFLCEFHMEVYPFDSQECQVVFAMKGNTGEFVELAVDSLQYLGPVDLIQYFVKGYKMTETVVPPGGARGVTVRIKFGRRLLSTFLTNYLPMGILCMVAFATNHFKAFFFEAVVTVNLTALLVLTTLFISISEGLPKTNYIKMMDIWCLVNLFVPFAEVLINTYIDSLRKDEGRVINRHGRAIKVKGVAMAPGPKVGNLKASKEPGRPAASGSESGSGIGGKVGSGGRGIGGATYPRELVARNEELEVAARNSLYADHLTVASPHRMRVAKAVARVGFPVAYGAFVACYFAVGYGIYNGDQWEE